MNFWQVPGGEETGGGEEVKAKERETRVYDVRKFFPDDPYRRMRFSDLIYTIVDTIAWDTWEENGGEIGSIRRVDGQLVIRQTRENHEAIGQLLERLGGFSRIVSGPVPSRRSFPPALFVTAYGDEFPLRIYVDGKRELDVVVSSGTHSPAMYDISLSAGKRVIVLENPQTGGKRTIPVWMEEDVFMNVHVGGLYVTFSNKPFPIF